MVVVQRKARIKSWIDGLRDRLHGTVHRRRSESEPDPMLSRGP